CRRGPRTNDECAKSVCRRRHESWPIAGGVGNCRWPSRGERSRSVSDGRNKSAVMISTQQSSKTEIAGDASPAPARCPRGAEILIEALVREGVDSIFGYPGGAVLHIYDELWRSRDRLTHYLVRHEQGAVHMAEGYARSSGRVGVALVTSGPGATNAVTGIANAYMDSTPIVVITGQVPLPLIGTDAFQEVDTVGITRPCVKHNYLVRDVADLNAIVHEAFYLARSGRPGPVVIDIPKDVSAAKTNYSRLEKVRLP